MAVFYHSFLRELKKKGCSEYPSLILKIDHLKHIAYRNKTNWSVKTFKSVWYDRDVLLCTCPVNDKKHDSTISSVSTPEFVRISQRLSLETEVSLVKQCSSGDCESECHLSTGDHVTL